MTLIDEAEDHTPLGVRNTASAAEHGSEAGPREPRHDAREDSAAYAWLFDSLTRAVETGPWWRRWWTAAVDAAQSSWRSGFSALSGAERIPRRRGFTLVAAGGAALVLSTTGVVASVQESWTPAIGAALKFDEPRPAQQEEPANRPADLQLAQPAPRTPSAGDERVAGRANDAAEPVPTGNRDRDAGGSPSRSNAPSSSSPQRRTAASTSDSAPEREPDSAPDQEPATNPGPESAPAPAAAAAAPAPAPAAPAAPSTLGPGGRLGSGGMLTSPNGRYSLVMQSDGNLVTNRNGVGPMWSSRTHGNPGAILVNQADGNVVVNGPSRALWSTRTAGKSGTVLVVQDDGNVVAYAAGASVWASGTAQ